MGYAYYSRERLDGSGYDGLIRFSGGTIESASEGRWIEDRDLIRHVFRPERTRRFDHPESASSPSATASPL